MKREKTETFKKDIGLFFGSFNPIHAGHLIIANYMANHTSLSEVWLIVSPHNPLKAKSSLANGLDRLEMAELALAQANNIQVSPVEFALPQPSYTIDTLTHLQERYPAYRFSLIMGSDNLYSFHKWKNADKILEHFRVAVYPRPGYLDHALLSHPSVTVTDTPLMELSSTFIRTALREGRDIRYFVPDAVLDFIDKKGLYL